MVTGSDPRVLAQPRHNGGWDAGAYFRLAYRPAGRCFVAEGPTSRNSWSPMVWPTGTKGVRDGDRVGVSVPTSPWFFFRRTTFWVGDLVEGGGGSIRASSRYFHDAPLTGDCFSSPSSGEVFVLNSAYRPTGAWGSPGLPGD